MSGCRNGSFAHTVQHGHEAFVPMLLALELLRAPIDDMVDAVEAVATEATPDL